MARLPDRNSEDGLQRLLTFCDAVVAIALTLLVLPLADTAGNLKADATALDIWHDHSNQIISFLISFAVIGANWRHHQSLMEEFLCYDTTLVWLNFGWLLSIVALPMTTALPNSKLDYALAVYIVNLAMSIIALIAIQLWGAMNPELIRDPAEHRLYPPNAIDFGTLATLLIAFTIAVIYPRIGAWPLFALVAARPIDYLVHRVLHPAR